MKIRLEKQCALCSRIIDRYQKVCHSDACMNTYKEHKNSDWFKMLCQTAERQFTIDKHEMLSLLDDYHYEPIQPDEGISYRNQLIASEHYLLGMSNRDIGKKHGITGQQVGVILRQMKAK